MKKIAILMSLVVSLTMFSGCGETKTKLKYDTLENVRNSIDSALSKEYNHITINKNITVDIPDTVNVYDTSYISLIKDKDDPKIKDLLGILYDSDDFDKGKNIGDEIFESFLEEDTENAVYQYFNKTKDENAAIGKDGYLHLGPDELLNTHVIECSYADRIKDNEVYKKVRSAADSKLEQAVSLQDNYNMEPYLFYKVESEQGNSFYKIYYCRTFDGLLNMPFGADNITNIDISESGSVQNRWIMDEVSVWVDENFSVRAMHIQNLWKARKNEALEKIPTLDSVLNYISKEIAPNYNVNVSNIKLMYAHDITDNKIYPVWYVEFSNNSNDIEYSNRIIVNSSTGLISSYIEGSYAEHQG